MTVIQILPWLSTHGKKGISPQHGRMASVHNQRIWVFATFFVSFGCCLSVVLSPTLLFVSFLIKNQ
jgi:hypothetical protein